MGRKTASHPETVGAVGLTAIAHDPSVVAKLSARTVPAMDHTPATAMYAAPELGDLYQAALASVRRGEDPADSTSDTVTAHVSFRRLDQADQPETRQPQGNIH